MADARGSGEAIQRVLEATGNRDVQAIVLVWNLSDGRGGAEGCGLPAYWVPGPADAPVSDYLREAYNMEVVHPLTHGVHGTAAFGPDSTCCTPVWAERSATTPIIRETSSSDSVTHAGGRSTG